MCQGCKCKTNAVVSVVFSVDAPNISKRLITINYIYNGIKSIRINEWIMFIIYAFVTLEPEKSE